MATITDPVHSKPKQALDKAVIRFCGDSGDGMQISGSQFTNTVALFGNDLATFPDYPAEIRAPAGTLPGVSGYQIQFSSSDVYTPGDSVDVLVAMNPAALKMNIKDLKSNGILIVNSDSFAEADLRKAHDTTNPLEDHSLDGYRVFPVALEKLTQAALQDLGMDAKSMNRCKNFFALGMAYWLYNRPLDSTYRWLEDKFKNKPLLVEANKRALKAGYSYCEATEAFQVSYEIPPAKLAPGVYRNLSGNQALAIGFVIAANRAGLPLFLGSYPITPASDILHELSGYKNFNVLTFQAEDEIAAITSAIGASYSGALALTTTSGPGMALKTEAMGLAVAIELPMVICNIQRGGPSTGLPTKTEQADLLQALYGRNSEAPIPILAPSTPGDCFWVAFEASRLALKYMIPVIILSDGYLANGAEPWRIPDLSEIPPIPVHFATNPEGFLPYKRDPQTLARPWAIPGTPGLEHRVGGLEKQDVTGNVNYEPLNHEKMVRLRAAKVEAICQDIPDVVPAGDPDGDLLIVGWGSTYGSITAAVRAQRDSGHSIGHVHLRHLNPLPANLGDVLKRYRKVLVPEMNLGQLVMILRAKYLIDAQGYNKIQGQPFKQSEIEAKIEEVLADARVTGRSQKMSTTTSPLTKKDFQTDQEVRWCPGCGDYAILSAVQAVFPELGIPREKFVVVSGIGCSSRFPYYMNTYGFHSIHGRAPAVATGIKITHPELEVWVATGDGDSLSIGGNHTIHMLRRNVGLKVLMFNNRIYGLTKGQYSPTSEMGKKTKSTPFGSEARPFNPLALAIGAEATFVARSVDVFQQHLKDTLRKAAAHKGSAYVEILQNCNIFNDGAWQNLTEKDARSERIVYLEHGKPLVFGKNRDKGIRLNGLDLEIVTLGNGISEKDLLIHDEEYRNPTYAFLLAKMEELPDFPTPVGVLRRWEGIPRYEDLVNAQVQEVTAKRGAGDIAKLLRSGDTWEVR